MRPTTRNTKQNQPIASLRMRQDGVPRESNQSDGGVATVTTATGSSSKEKGKGIDWSKAVANPYAAKLRNRRWWVEFDPDLTELLWGKGDLVQRLRRIARGTRRRERLVSMVPMTEADYKAFKPFLRRIGAKAKYQPPHPSWATLESRRRKTD